MADKLFGTDGVRAIANTYPLTIDFCTELAIILSNNFCTKQKKVAIARDTRLSGSMLFNALCAGFTSQGINVIDLGIIPTPLCTTLTPKLDVDMSIMITASHNPYRDNGLKLINSAGDKFSDAETNMIENLLHQNLKAEYSPLHIGSVIKHDCGLKDYLQTIQNITQKDKLKGMKIAIDSANGVFSGIMSEVFKFLGAEVISLADTPNGTNINQDCGSQHTEMLSHTVVKNSCRLGIAVDGDGDRIIICDEKGKRLDGDQIIAYLATYLKKHNMLKGNAVVSTIYSNLGLGKYINSLGLQHYTSAVGERYVIAKMREVGCNLGGEESGHMVLSDYSLTGDALLAAVIICLGINENPKHVSEIFPVFKPFPSISHNLRFKDKEIINKIMEHQEVKDCIAQISENLKGHGTILVRKSGTEPVIRLKIEDENPDIAAKEAEKILNCINVLNVIFG
ncbi:MAG: phosphoglucosamine mutase [Alphaproteobacteria bacterium]|nr:phosphoglucosamine mutase [Alphaproteobacteria bacterium]